MSLDPPGYAEAVRGDSEGPVTKADLAGMAGDILELRELVRQLKNELSAQRERADKADQRINYLNSLINAANPPAIENKREPAAAENYASVEEIILMKRVTNAMLYLRFALSRNLDGLRDSYITRENMAIMQTDPTGDEFAKLNSGTPAEQYERYSALGATLWGRLHAEDQDHIRDLYAEWKDRVKKLGVDIDKAARGRASKK